ncbi:hypothetical protein FSP39_017889 [Pinctada imbricata]|uniref:Tyr recombinase domain-containing protein n=1 Tax=Pinctada imbricata TaxID=66713 RepID=A0AA89C1U6_PINIB|nr:hypothetical protein FSP39_017889 [Pinctada imbricata]
MSPVMGNIVRLMTRKCYVAIESRESWDRKLSLSSLNSVIEEIGFWCKNLSLYNHRFLFLSKEKNVIVYSDASDSACAACTVEVEEKVFHRMWTDNERLQSSTWRELKAIEDALKSFSNYLAGKSLKWFTDNQNCEKIVQSGSMKPNLQDMALNIFSTCISHGIDLDIQWVPRKMNERADYLSKIIDLDDWCISNSCFDYISSIWGPFTIDRFASSSNNKVPRFNSMFWNPGSEHVDYVFNTGRWTSTLLDSRNMRDQRLQELTSLLPSYCLKAKADNTRRQYRYAYKHFSDWCISHALTSLPASDHTVSMYIIHLAQTYSSAPKIEESTHAISWFHDLAGFTDPCQSNLVKQVKEGAIRDTKKPVCRKEPISAQHMSLLVDKFGNEKCSLYDLRTTTMCLLSYAGFLRFSELSNLRMCDVNFFQTHVTLYIVKSKTDKYKAGSTVCISKTGLSTCPVSMLSKYIEKANISPSSEEYLFRQLTYFKKSESFRLRKVNKPISYTRSREIILLAFESIGLDKSKFGLHSLRSGGATAAASAGINDRIFKKHGRWKTDKAKDGYVTENLVEKLSVTKNLGI